MNTLALPIRQIKLRQILQQIISSSVEAVAFQALQVNVKAMNNIPKGGVLLKSFLTDWVLYILSIKLGAFA